MPRSATTSSYRTSARWTESEARAALSALDASSLSVIAFAQREGLDAQRLYSWRRKLADGGGGRPRFGEIRPLAARERIERTMRGRSLDCGRRAIASVRSSRGSPSKTE